MPTKTVNKTDRVNQLTEMKDFDIKRVVFSEPQEGKVADTPIVYKRINISILNRDGTIGDLIVATPRVFSFGVSENVNPETKKVSGHSLPLCMWSKNGATAEEKQWTKKFEELVEACKDHIITVRDQLDQPELTKAELRKLNPLYYKRDKVTKKLIEGVGPTLYPKLIESKKDNKIKSMFFSNDQQLDPLSIAGKYCYVNAAIKIESIFVGAKIALQVKLYEATVELVDSGMKPLMNRPSGPSRMLTGDSTNMNEMRGADPDDDEGGEVRVDPPTPKAGSVHGSDTDEPAPAKKADAEGGARKVKKKVGAGTK